jgi:hypothetical protein
MCESASKLVAWLDQELSEDEAAVVRRNIETCKECRSKLEAYRQVSGAFDAYWQSKMETRSRQWRSRLLPSLAIGTAAAAVLLFAYLLRPLELPPFRSAPPGASLNGMAPATDFTTTQQSNPAAATPLAAKVHARRNIRPHLRRDSSPPATAPGIQIAIPADAMFPPGAMPTDVAFTAEFSVAPDGSVQRMRIQPRLIELERSTPQP